MVLAIGVYGTFFVYFVGTGFCFVYFLKEIKETTGLSIEEVDKLYSNWY